MQVTLKNINKSFNTNVVLHNVSLALNEGEIHALLGENGAGKSTLMNILGGVLPADSGEIYVDGICTRISSPSDALNRGIAFIHQELNLVNDLTVYENLFLGEEMKNGIFLSKRKMIEKSKEILASMSADIDPTQIVGHLDASYKQIVEIARALLFNARLIIMDEPTTSLTSDEIERIFGIMRTLKENGVSIVFISHKLREVTEICDCYSVLRNGSVVSSGKISDVNELDLAGMMVGHEFSTKRLERSVCIGEEILKCDGLTLEPYYRNVSFSLKRGEIVGFTGLLGDGRSEIFQTILGYLHGAHGSIEYKKKIYKPTTTGKAASLGIGYVPRNRKENGIIKDLSILENGSIVIYRKLRRFLLTNHRLENKKMDALIEKLRIKLIDKNSPITSLSGGNQQKVVLAKWLNADSDVLIFDNPTQGVDIGAKEDIYDIILSLAEHGTAVVVLSGEAQEIIRLCDRTYVMYHGNITKELIGDEMNESRILQFATGADTAACDEENVL